MQQYVSTKGDRTGSHLKHPHMYQIPSFFHTQPKIFISQDTLPVLSSYDVFQTVGAGQIKSMDMNAWYFDTFVSLFLHPGCTEQMLSAAIA